MDCLLITTNLEERFEKLKKCTEYLNKFNFKTKNLSIDCFTENAVQDFSFFEKNGWNINKHERKGIFGNIVEGLKGLESEWLFYCEDDVAVEKIPTHDEIISIQNLKSGNRKAGYISFMFGGMEEGRNVKELNEYLKSKKSYKDVSKESQIFLRQEKFKNDFFINFPVALFQKEALNELVDYIKLYKQGKQVEQAFSEAWIEKGMCERYFSLSYIKKFDPLNVKLKMLSETTEQQKSYFGDNLNTFIESRSFIHTISNYFIYVKTLENNWNDNSIIGGKSC